MGDTADLPVLEGIPVIDASMFMAQSNDGVAPPQNVTDLIHQACCTWGFFQLVNHGVSQDLLNEHYAAMTRFFALPMPDKLSCKRSVDNSMVSTCMDRGRRHLGLSALRQVHEGICFEQQQAITQTTQGYFNDEYTKNKLDLKEGFDFRHTPNPGLPDDHSDNYDPQGVNRWPEVQHEFRETNQRYFREMSRVAFRLLEVFAMGLGLPHNALHHLFQPSHTSFLRLNCYPVRQDAPPDGLGISPHKDAGFLTVLVQDTVPGLQVLHGGQWHLVPPVPGALTINVGDMAQVFTNDRFYASNHRVLQSELSPRYSRAFFFNPSHGANIEPSISNDRETPHYHPINWWEFRRKRFEGDYANVGEEVQIDWYRINEAQPLHPHLAQALPCHTCSSAAADAQQ
eukprot:GHRR01009914.1.p1 GENE.GHRR01009914.1~~GHRR01009914.1.p1  ORF type:complete len:398 (+),score=78.90 GHRR01009914.1:2576-3769(+)